SFSATDASFAYTTSASRISTATRKGVERGLAPLAGSGAEPRSTTATAAQRLSSTDNCWDPDAESCQASLQPPERCAARLERPPAPWPETPWPDRGWRTGCGR